MKILLLLVMSFFLVGCATPTKTTVTMPNGDVEVYEDYSENARHHWNGDKTLYLTNGGKVHVPSGSRVEVEVAE